MIDALKEFIDVLEKSQAKAEDKYKQNTCEMCGTKSENIVLHKYGATLIRACEHCIRTLEAQKWK